MVVREQRSRFRTNKGAAAPVVRSGCRYFIDDHVVPAFLF
jgi:hypothetical protein